jgi:hypothetical protein
MSSSARQSNAVRLMRAAMDRGAAAAYTGAQHATPEPIKAQAFLKEGVCLPMDQVQVGDRPRW